MTATTQPIFIVGTGRCGTRSLYKMLTGLEGFDVHHEYVCTHVQKLAALYYMGRIDSAKALSELEEWYFPAICYTKAATWIDSSNKLSWIIDLLAARFPDAKFLAMMRDGRKVVSSFYYKLRDEMYDDRSTAILKAWLDEPSKPVPPPEKKYWWNIPQLGQPFYSEFANFDRFKRVAYHWVECNRIILNGLHQLASSRWRVVNLEDLVSDNSVLRSTLDFLGVDYEDSYADFLKTPQNVFFPMDFRLSEKQLAEFRAIAQPMMQSLGYVSESTYVVNY